MGQDGVERRTAARSAAFEQRGLEPPAVLVRPFEIEVGGPALVGPAAAFQNESVGRTAIEPDVENVGDHLVIVGVARLAEEGGGVGGVPGVYASLADGGDDALVHFMVDEELAGLALDEQGDRHAPGTLAAEHPVGTPLDHRADAVAALLRNEAGLGDGVHRQLAEGRALGLVDRVGTAFIVPALFRPGFRRELAERLVHRDEPLRRAAVDDLCLRPPAMRIAVLEIRARREQRAVASRKSVQIGPSGALNLALMTLRLRFLSRARPSPVITKTAIGLNGEHRIDSVGLAQFEIVLAVVGRHMDEARALVGSDKIAWQGGGEALRRTPPHAHRVVGCCSTQLLARKPSEFADFQ